MKRPCTTLSGTRPRNSNSRSDVMCSSVSFRAFRAFGFFPVISLSICGLRCPVLRGFRRSDSRDMVQEIAVRQALPQCLRGSFEFVVKMAFLDWEAAVLPLNYARDINYLAVMDPELYCHHVDGSMLQPTYSIRNVSFKSFGRAV